MLTALFLQLTLTAGPALDVRPFFEVRGEAPKDDEQRALYDAYRTWLDAMSGPLEAPVLTFREVRQPFLGKRRLVVATGAANGGHRNLRTLWLVRDKKATLVLSATAKAGERASPLLALDDVRLCPVAHAIDQAKAIDGGTPPDDTSCVSVRTELSRGAMLRGDQGAAGEALVLLLSALLDTSEPGIVVTDPTSLPKGYLDTLAGKATPGFQRFAPRASNVTAFFTTLREGRTLAQGLVRSGRSARILETIALEVTAEKLEFSREHLAAQILLP